MKLRQIDDGTITIANVPGLTESELSAVSNLNGYHLTNETAAGAGSFTVSFAADTTQTVVTALTYEADNQEVKISAHDNTASSSITIPAEYTTVFNGKTNAALSTADGLSDALTKIKNYLAGLHYQLDSITFGDKTYTDSDFALASLNFDATQNGAATTDSSPQTIVLNYSHATQEASRNKTVTRTIHYVYENGAKAFDDITASQTYTETGTTDLVTNTTTWDDSSWNPASYTFAAVTSQALTGYTPSAATVAAQTVTVNNANFDNNLDIAETVTYTADPQVLDLKVHDQTTNTDLTIPADYTSSFAGTSNGAVDTDKVKSAIAALKTYYAGLGYVYESNTDIPSTYDTDDAANQTVTITLTHKLVTVTPDAPKTPSDQIPDTKQKYPDGVAADDLNKTITRTINITYPDGSTETEKQTVKLTRQATVDAVTGAVTYGSWSTGSWSEYALTPKTGYTIKTVTSDGTTSSEVDNASAVAAETVTSATADTTVNVTYVADYQQYLLKVVDGDKENEELSLDLPGVTASYDGTTGASLTDSQVATMKSSLATLLQYYKAKGYTIKDEDFASLLASLSSLEFDSTDNLAATTDATPQYVTLTLNHQKVTVTPDAPKDEGTTIDGTEQTYPSGVSENDLNKTITRTITVHVPGGSAQVVTQEVKYTRTATVDAVTKAVAYSDWTSSDGTWDAYTVPSFAGYTAHVSGSVDSKKVAVTDKDETADITYTADPQELVLKVHDQTTGSDLTIPANYTSSFAGTSNGAVDTDKVKSAIAALKTYYAGLGYDYVAISAIPDTYDTDDATNQTVTVTLKHGSVTVEPSDPKTSSDTIDGTSTKYPDGVGENDLNKTITRTITVAYPDGTTKTLTQAVKYTRTATVDTVTGKITGYSSWTTDNNTWAAYTPEPLAGYTAESAPEVTVSSADADSSITLKYTAHNQYLHFAVTDETTNKSLDPTASGITSHFTGTSNATVDASVTSDFKQLIAYYEQLGYEVVSADSVPTLYDTADAVDQVVNLKLKHKLVTVTADDPKNQGTTIDGTSQTYPNGVAKTDLNRTVTRTINIYYPDKTTGRVVQDAVFTRSAVVDAVTGAVTYNAWTSVDPTWDEYDAKTIDGYTAVPTKYEAQTVTAEDKDATVEITYKPNVQHLTIKLYDKDKNSAELAANVDGITNNFSGYSDTAVSSAVAESVAELISYYEKQGYTLVEQDNVPADYDADDETEQVIKVYFAHKLVTVEPTDGKTTTDTIPGTEVNYPAGVAETDLNKSITRTITVHKPNGSEEIVTQTVSYARKAEVDAVTQQVTYGAWTVSSQGNVWKSYTAPVISGYTADSSSPVSEKIVAVTDSDASVDIYYYADPQNLDVVVTDKTTGETLDPTASDIKVKFVGDSNSAIDTASVDHSLAKLQQYYAELGYEVYSTDSVPTTYDDDDATDQKVNLVLQHKLVTVTADDPKDAGTTIDGTSQTYPAGLTKTELSKTITRTITVIKPDGTSQTITQPVTYTRTATVDVVTKAVSYSSWISSNNIWNSYAPEKLAGYTPSQNSVASKTVSVDDGDESLVITYTPDQQKLQIQVSDTTTGSTLDPSASGVTTDFTGESDGKVPASVKTSLDQLISYYEAKGYEVASQSDLPANYDTDDATDQTVSLVLKHKYVTVEANDPKNPDDPIDGTSQTYPKGVAESDLNKTITRTIKVNLPNATAITITQPVTYTRHAVVDAVTGEITYGSWTAENSDDTWDEYNAPTVTGYTALPGKISAKQVAVTDSDASVVIDYSADAQTLVIQVVDDTTGKALDAAADGAQSSFSGVTDGAVQDDVSENMAKLISYYESQGYTLVKADSAPKSYDDDDKTEQVVTIHMAHRTITVEPGNPKTTTDTIDGTSKSYPEGVAESDLNKTITRTINVTDPDGNTTTITQVVKYQRNASFDAVDPAAITYGDWKLASDSNTWEVYNPEAISGYTPSQSVVEAQTVTASDRDAVVNITYAANPQQLTIAITDQTTGKTLTAPSEIPTSFTGNSNGNVGTEPSSSLSSLISYYEGLGYELVSSGSVPEKYDTDDAVDQVINLVLKHKTVTVTADNPKTTSDPIDGTKVNYPSGVSASDLNKTITRTITITYPDGTTETVTQPVNYARTATVDAVTGEVSYSEWTSGDNIWDKYTPEAVAGYTPSQSSVDAKSVAASDSNSTVAITYTPNTQKLAIVVKDADGNTLNANGSGITTNFTGDSDSSVGTKLSDNLKDLTAYYEGLGYDIVSTSTIPTTYDHDDKTDQTVKVTVKARIIPVSADDPKTSVDKISGTKQNYPEGVGESDLNRVITRTINVTDPDGTTKAITQTVKYTRNAIVNAVTGEVTYSAWTSENALWDVYDVPVIPGYKASQNVVNGQEVAPEMEDQTIDIDYAAQTQNLKFIATDETTGQTIDLTKSGITTSFAGNSNGVIPAEASQARQKLIDYLESLGYKVEAGSLPSKFDTDTAVDQTVSFNLTHKTESAQETKTITRTINVTDPDGRTKTITQPVKFTRTKTTDLVTKESTYTEWTSGNSQWTSVNVPTIPGYTASQNEVNGQEVTPEMEDQTIDIDYAAQAQNLKFIATDQTTGQTIDLTKSGITTSFAGNSNGTIPAEASQARQKLIDYLESLGYKVEAGSLPSKFDTDTAVDQTLSFNLTHKTESAQETKTITRTIKITSPDGRTKTITQPVKFTRTKTTDLVTKESAYTAWTSENSRWDAYDVPAIPGYTASQNEVNGQEVTPEMEDQTVNVGYTAQAQNLKFIATDETTGQSVDLTKSGITTSFTGTSNGTIPAEASQARQKLIAYLESLGYKVEAGSLPTKFDTDAGVDQTVSFNLTHKTESAQETKTITRTIRLHQPNGSVKEIKQTVVFTRTKTTDLVTKEDTYTAWTSENSQWASIIVPTISGYQASIKVVKAEKVTSDAENEIIDVTYSAIKPAKPAPTPKQPAKPQPKDNGRANATSTSKQPSQSEGQNELPQTGENNAAASVGILSMLLGLLGIGFERRRKRR
ncbi:mucin-binding protein [Lactobacillus corticis]|uniref:Mucus-binding protein n=1 Tax=Lactobacillus corticis TaxID=2201249 RepID=A0A916VIU3_9LACO|nr:LPXTG cell wall anchor domain-containing protein [Lactobacillus corticis]GFZ26354.1 mucus-binding protein [Lactobacillus corticis]